MTLDDDGTLQRQLFLLAGLYHEEECEELTLITSLLLNRSDRVTGTAI